MVWFGHFGKTEQFYEFLYKSKFLICHTKLACKELANREWRPVAGGVEGKGGRRRRVNWFFCISFNIRFVVHGRQ